MAPLLSSATRRSGEEKRFGFTPQRGWLHSATRIGFFGQRSRPNQSEADGFAKSNQSNAEVRSSPQRGWLCQIKPLCCFATHRFSAELCFAPQCGWIDLFFFSKQHLWPRPHYLAYQHRELGNAEDRRSRVLRSPRCFDLACYAGQRSHPRCFASLWRSESASSPQSGEEHFLNDFWFDAAYLYYFVFLGRNWYLLEPP